MQRGNKTEYAVTNQVVRSLTVVARYTKVRIRRGIMSGKLISGNPLGLVMPHKLICSVHFSRCSKLFAHC